MYLKRLFSLKSSRLYMVNMLGEGKFFLFFYYYYFFYEGRSMALSNSLVTLLSSHLTEGLVAELGD